MVIDISHQKGGTGKSTIAYNLADAYRKQGKKVKLYDLDLQHTCIGLNGLRDNPFNDIFTVDNENELVDIINKAQKEDIIIIDSGGFDSSLTRLAIMGADINLTPVADKVTELLAVIQKYSVILDEIKQETGEEVKSYIILNKIHIFAEKFEHIEEMIEENSQLKMLKLNNKPLAIRERAIYNKSFINGRSIYEAKELSGYKDSINEFNNLSKKLLEIYQNQL